MVIIIIVKYIKKNRIIKHTKSIGNCILRGDRLAGGLCCVGWDEHTSPGGEFGRGGSR